MAIVLGSSSEFPRILTLVAGAGGIFVGLFAFIFSCILKRAAYIMLAMVIIGAAVILLLTAVHILMQFQTNVPLTILLVIFSMICSFMEFVNFCQLARANSIVSKHVNTNAYFAVSIVLVLLLLALMAFYAFLVVILLKHHQKMVLTGSSASTTVTSTSKTVATTIETPPANYINQPISQVPK